MPYDRTAFTTRTPEESFCFDLASNMEAAEGRPGFIADAIFTPKPVKKSRFKVYQYDTSKLRAVTNAKKSSKAEAAVIDEQIFGTDLTSEPYGLKQNVDPREVAEADVPHMVGIERAQKHVMAKLLLAREKEAATLVGTAANYPSSLTQALASGSKWNEAGGAPEDDAVTAHNALILQCGRRANAMAMDITTFNKLKLSPQFRDRVKYTTGGPVTEDAVKAFFGVQYLFLAQALENSANEGATDSVASVWGTNVLMFVHNPSPQLDDMSYGHMYMPSMSPFVPYFGQNERVRTTHGALQYVEISAEWKLGAGFVVSSSDSDFAAGYLFRTTVA